MFTSLSQIQASGTFVDVLRLRSANEPTRRAFTFLLDGEAKEVTLTFAELDRKARAIAEALSAGAAPGERALLLYPPGLEFVEAFFGCLYAGLVAVPAYPPHPKRRDRTFDRICAIGRDSEPRLALTTAELLPALERLSAEEPSFKGVSLRSTDDIDPSTGDYWMRPAIDGRTLAFLQYTSGSTGIPKGVMVSHANLLHNEAMLTAAFESTCASTFAGWLPLFHDMGLMGNVLQPLFVGAHSVLLAPVAFLQRPARWLEAVSRFGARIGGGPNFGYELCVEKVTPEEMETLDLSSWEIAFNGAEPVRQETLERFSEKFAPCGFNATAHWPCYGMAETTLFVSGGRKSEPSKHQVLDAQALTNHRAVPAKGQPVPAKGQTGNTVRLVGCGRSWLDQQIRIVDPETRRPCEDRNIGEIWIGGPHVAQGYWQRSEETTETFQALLADNSDTPYLRTGDLGYLDEGELYVTGRLKDVIIIRGSNHYPQDIEYTVQQAHAALRAGCGGAFSVDIEGQEQLVVCQEVRRENRKMSPEEMEAVFQAISSAIAGEHGLEVHTICLLQVGRMPKTSSGKLQRRQCRELFLADQIETIGRWTIVAARETADTQPLPASARGAGTHQSGGEHGLPAEEEANRRQDFAIEPAEKRIRRWLIERIAAKRNVDTRGVDVHAAFASFAIDSKASVVMAGDLERLLGMRLPATLLYEYPSIAELSAYLASVAPASFCRQESEQGAAQGTEEAGPAELNLREAIGRKLSPHSAERIPCQPAPQETLADKNLAEPIAIVGVGCRFPGADSAEQFWRLLQEGMHAVREVPPDRWDADAFFSMDPQAGKTNTRWGGFLEGIDQFDPQFFGIAPREAERMDPQQRLLLEVTWQALADAGVPCESLSGTPTGVFVGLSSNDYGRMQLDDAGLCDAYVGSGSALSIAANRISYLLNLRGPSLAIDTACSSSLVAVHLACESLRRGESKVALAGGVNVILSPIVTANFTQGGFMSPSGRCQAFSANADGYVRSEGAGVIVLKPLGQAVADGDPIYAVIRGGAVNQDGRSNGLTAPNRAAQEAVLRAAYEDAGVDPAKVQYIEAHGTGTLLGDPIEARALGAVLGADRPSDSPCRLGSVKSNLGHLESAAGIAGLIKVALALRHGYLPASLHAETLNPHIPFEELRLKLLQQPAPWQEGSGVRLAGVSSFGFGGTNAHVVLQSAPLPAGQSEKQTPDNEQPQLLPISAHSAEALRELASRVRDWVADQPPQALADISFTLRSRRTQFPHRLAVIANDRAAWTAGIDAFLAGQPSRAAMAGQVGAERERGIAFVFCGQGPQWSGMGRELWQHCLAFREEVKCCDALVQALAGWSLIELLFAPEDDGRLAQTRFAQPLLFALQAGLTAQWREWGVLPAAVVGHSAGEVAAAYASGALALPAAVQVIVARAEQMQQAAGSGGMLATQMTRSQAEVLCQQFGANLVVAAENGPQSITFSGPDDTIDRLAAELNGQGIFCRRLRGNVAFHSAAMEPTAQWLKANLEDVAPKDGQVPFYSSVTGRLHAGRELHADYWSRNARHLVQFAGATGELLAEGYDCFLEIGPHPVLGTALESTAGERGIQAQVLFSLHRKQPECETLLAAAGQMLVAGLPIKLPAIRAQQGGVVPLPAFAWQRERYWLPEDRTGSGVRSWASAGESQQHPLLGRRDQDAEGGWVWESELDSRQLAARGEYSFAGASIAPTALLIEWITAAGSEGFGPDYALEMRGLKFGDPLVLLEGQRRRLQVRFTPSGPRSAEVRLTSCMVGDGNWYCHVHGQIFAHDPSVSHATPDLVSADEVRAAPAQEIPGDEYYRRLQQAGVTSTRSLCRVERIWQKNGYALAHVAVEQENAPPGDTQRLEQGSIEACFQTTGLVLGGRRGATEDRPNQADEQGEILLPITIERLLLMPQAVARVSHGVELQGGKETPCRHTLVAEKTDPPGAASVQLLDAGGNTVGAITGLTMRPYSRSEIQAMVRSDLQEWLYQPRWRPAPLKSAEVPPSQFMLAPDDLAARMGPQAAAALDALQRFAPLLSELDTLSAAYAARALTDCGCQLERGSLLAAEGLFERLGIVAEHQRLLGRLLQILEDDGVVGKIGSGQWVVKKTPPQLDTEALQGSLAVEYPECQAELTLLARCGPRLADVLRGNCDPLTLIFPRGSTELAQRVYQDSPFARNFNQLAREAVRRAIADLPAGRKLRVLEIGAGTGGTTSHLLPEFPAERTRYVFTDVSAAFMVDARARFADQPFVEFQTLDIEQDIEQQGFEPGGFDLVIAANALHATADLRTSLTHARRLLAPGGLLMLLEITSPQRWLDLVFGLTAGWWRFSDHRDRPSHPLISRFNWRYLFEQTGYEAAVAVPDESLSSIQGVMIAQAPLQPAQQQAIDDRPGDAWLVVSDGEALGQRLAEQLRSRGEPCVLAGPGEDGLQAAGQDSYRLDTGDIEQIGHLLGQAFPAATRGCRGIFYLATRGDREDQMFSITTLEQAARRDCGPLLALMQTAAGYQWSTPPRLWLVTRGGQGVEQHEKPSGVQAAMWGLGRVLSREHPAFWGGLIDLEPGAADEVSAGLLCEQLLRGETEDQVAFRHDQRYALRLARLEASGQSPGSLRFRQDGAYLITGGLGGLGLLTARWMARRGARRLILLGRSPLPPRAEWRAADPTGTPGRRIAAVRELESLGASVHVMSIDLADELSLAAELEKYYAEEWPPIRGVMHAAGISDDTPLTALDLNGLMETLRPKIAVGPLVERLHRQYPLDFVVMFSSAGALFGQTGQAAYAAANAALDTLALRYRSRGIAALTINWSAVADLGLADRQVSHHLMKRLALQGIEPIRAEQVTLLLGRLLAEDHVQAAILPIDWSRFSAQGERDRPDPLLAELSMEQPGVAPGPEKKSLLTRDALLSAGEAERSSLVENDLRRRLAAVLGTPVDRVDTAQPLSAFGLDSLMAVQLKNQIAAGVGVELPVVAFLQGDNLAQLAQLLLERLFDAPGADAPALLSADEPPDEFPLSLNQEAFWFFNQLLPEGMGLNAPAALRIRSSVDAAALERALAALAARHDSLRMTIHVGPEGPVQRVAPRIATPFELVEAGGWSAAELQQRLEEDANRAFDWKQGPIFRAVLYRLAPEHHVLLLSVDHIAVDFWSITVLANDLGTLYDCEAAGQPAAFEPLELRFSDFVRWQNEYARSGAGERDWQYWREKFAGPLPQLDLPSDRPRPDVQSFSASVEQVELPADLTARVKECCGQQGITLYTLLLAAYQGLLHRYSGAEDVCVGSVIAGRSDPKLSDVVGYFINPVALRTDFSGDLTFDALLARVKATVLEAIEHQNFPLVELSQRLGMQRDTGRSPLFETFFILQRAHSRGDEGMAVFALGAEGARVQLGGLQAESVALTRPVGQFDLTLMMAEMGEHLIGNWTFSNDLFDRATIKQMSQDFCSLLSALVEDPAAGLTAVPLAGPLPWQRRRHWQGEPVDRIEAALTSHLGVNECAVRSESAADEEQRLVAYIAAGTRLTPAMLAEHLQQHLPAELCPQSYVFLTRLPRTPHGAIDEGTLLRLPVIDEAVALNWEKRLGDRPGIEEAAVVMREAGGECGRTHVGELIPGWQRFAAGETGKVSPADSSAQSESVGSATKASAISGAADAASIDAPSINGAANGRSGGHAGPHSSAIAIGPPIRWPAEVPLTLAGMLARAARESHAGLTYVRPDGTEFRESYAELLARAEKILAGLRKQGLQPQDKVLLQVDQNDDFLAVFWACVLGGFVPAPVSIAASYDEVNSGTSKLRNAWELLQQPLVVASATLASQIPEVAQLFNLEGFRVAEVGTLAAGDRDAAWHDSRPEDLALLLLTSGSTGKPKAVMQNHRSLIARCVATVQHNGFTADEVALSWMPLDHVGALVYFHLRDVYLGCREVQVPTPMILENPLLWLELAERYRASVTFAPNFAFGLINERAGELGRRQWDLSCLRHVLNGGEAIVPRTARRFLQLLTRHGLPPDAMTPAWGMSETSSGVTYGDRFRLETTADDQPFAELGPPLPGFEMRVVDEAGCPVSEGQNGQLQVRGETVTTGYYGQPELNDEVFTADGWFKTGDLAVIREGRLTITGREKDVIIINGVNFYSHEIEAAVEELDGVEVSYTAVAGVRIPAADTDQLAVFFHTPRSDDAERLALVGEIRRRVASQFNIRPDFVIPVEKQDVPKTAIGKIQRSQLVADLLAGKFEQPLRQLERAAGGINTVPDWFYRKVWQQCQSGPLQPLQPGQRILLIGGRGDITTAMADAIARCGAEPLVCYADATDYRYEQGVYHINAADPRHFVRLVEDALTGGELTGCIDLADYGLARSDPSSSGRPAGSDTEVAASSTLPLQRHSRLIWLAQALEKAGQDKRDRQLRILLASHGTAAITAEEPLAAERTLAVPLAMTLVREMPWLDVRHIDLPDSQASEEIAGNLLVELQAASGDYDVAYRGEKRFVPRLAEAKPQSSQQTTPPLRHRGIYLLTGGLGGIGAELAGYLLSTCDARLLVIGRSPLAEHTANNGSPNGAAHPDSEQRRDNEQRRQTFERLSALPGEIVYEQVDVTDATALNDAVRRAEDHWQARLAGAFHLAGAFTERLLLEETPATLSAALAAKTEGTRAVAKLCEGRKDCLLVGFSSVNSYFGGPSVGAYAAANRYLESACHELRRHGIAAFCCAWSMWHETGMSRGYAMKQASQARGYMSVSRAEGLHSLLACLAQEPGETVIGLDGTNANIRRSLAAGPCELVQPAVFYVAGGEKSRALPRPQLEERDRLGRAVECPFYQIESLPRTADGQVDRAKLAEQSPTSSSGGRTAPRNEVERVVCEIWQDVLNIAEVGIHDNFFSLGGDSILAVQAISRAGQAGLKFTPKQLFQRQTVAELAEVVERVAGIDAQQEPIIGGGPLVPIQRWFFEQDLPRPEHFNMAAMFEVPSDFDSNVAGRVLEHLLQQHDALRARYEKTPDGWRQHFLAPEAVSGDAVCHRHDLGRLEQADRLAAIDAVCLERHTGIDLRSGPLLYADHFDLGGGQPGRMLLLLHHLVVDGVSWRILVEDFQSLYGQLAAGEEVVLPPKTTSYQRWAERLIEYSASAELHDEAQHWLREPEGGYLLPTDHHQGENLVASSAVVSAELSVAETQALLKDVPEAYRTQINDVLLTALVKTTADWTGSSTLRLDLEGHGREELFDDVDLSRTVGWFTSLFPAVLELADTDNPGDQLKTIKEQLRCIPQRGVGYGILRYLSGDEQLSQRLRALPHPEVSFNYLGQLDQLSQPGAVLNFCNEPAGPAAAGEQTRAHLLDVIGMVHGGQLKLDWTYSGNYHRRETIVQLAQDYLENLRELISHCQAPQAGGFTPSDLPAARLSQQDLDKFLAAVTKGGKEDS